MLKKAKRALYISDTVISAAMSIASPKTEKVYATDYFALRKGVNKANLSNIASDLGTEIGIIAGTSLFGRLSSSDKQKLFNEALQSKDNWLYEIFGSFSSFNETL